MDGVKNEKNKQTSKARFPEKNQLLEPDRFGSFFRNGKKSEPEK